MGTLEQILAILKGHEGGLSLVEKDPGNWTSGKVGVGRLRGTRYGISAAAFPTLDIAALTWDAAAEIYRRLYWTPLQCDALPLPLALLVFDAGVNNGNANAARFLQRSVGAVADGLLGTASRRAVAAALGNGSPERVDVLCAEFMAQRTFFMAGLGTWSTFGLGWSRRLCRLPFQALRLAASHNDNAAATTRTAA